MGKDMEIPSDIEEIKEKAEELKIKFDKGEISREEYETENRKLQNQKRWVILYTDKSKIKKKIDFYEKKERKNNKTVPAIQSADLKKLCILLCVIIIPVVVVLVILSTIISPFIYLIFYIFLLIILVPIIIRQNYNRTVVKRLKKELQNYFELHDKVDINAVNFYKKCNDVVNTHSTVNLEDVIKLNGRNYGKNDLSSAKEYYYKGESDDFINRMIAEEQKKEQNRENRVKKYNDKLNKINSIRQFKGKDKYLASLIKLRKDADNLKGASENLSKISFNNAIYTPKKKDWAIAGGIGSALGGAALGLASAANTQIENQKQEVIAAQKREASKDQRATAIKGLSLAEEIRIFTDSRTSYFKDVLVDVENINDKFNMFKFGEIGITQEEVEDGNVIRVTVQYSLSDTIMLLSQKAILDGSLKISVYDKTSGEAVSSVFYIAPGYDQYNYKNAGFRNGSTISVDIPIFDNKVPDCNNLRCEITPDILWIIEENKEIFRKSNSDIDSKVKEYDKKLDDILRELCVSAYTG